MKKQLLAALLSAMLCTGLTACGTAAMPGKDNDKIRIVCTNFPEYDWVRQLTQGEEDAYEITYLLENGADLHNYQPSAMDMAKISCCDLFICVGGESERWVDDALAGAVNKSMRVVKLLDCVEAVEEETVEGMETEADEEAAEAEAPEYDEHIWLSVSNAKICCAQIVSQLAVIGDDDERFMKLNQNLDAYRRQLDALDSDFREVSEAMPGHMLIFADRFPFRYFVDDYGYNYYAAFAGCSAETEASFETIAFLAQKVDETGVSTVFTIEGGNTGIAEAVIANTKSKDQKTAVLNSIQSVTSEQVESGATYLSLMEGNLNVLKEAAGQK